MPEHALRATRELHNLYGASSNYMKKYRGAHVNVPETIIAWTVCNGRQLELKVAL